jgi:Domain of unknown function (DUF4440)
MKLKRLAFSILLAASISVAGFSQTAEDSVKTVVNSLFTAMKNSDGPALLRLFSDSAILQTIASSKTGETVIRSQKVNDFANVVSTLPKGDADERISFETVKVDGALAIVWTPYQFYYKSSFSHCGVNSFHLVRINGEWKIHFLIDTRRKMPCKP